MALYQEITPVIAQQLIESKDVVLLDQRDAHSYKEGHVEGAMLAHDDLTSALIRKKQIDKPVVIYCYHGNSSKDLAALFGNFGFKEVYSVAGGYTAWKRDLSQ